MAIRYITQTKNSIAKSVPFTRITVIVVLVKTVTFNIQVKLIQPMCLVKFVDIFSERVFVNLKTHAVININTQDTDTKKTTTTSEKKKTIDN